jgi:alkyl hydroperoxide reductase subunit D
MNIPLINESVTNLLAELGLDASASSCSLVSLANANNRYLKELKLNLAAVLGSSNLKRKEALLLALSVAVNEKNNILIQAFENLSLKDGASIDEIGETHACVSLMNVNNVVYRFRHFMGANEYYNNHPLGLRMGLMLNPILGKALFELMSLVISAVNGCEKCVTSHEQSVKSQNVSEASIYDAIRLGAVVKGLCTVF